MIVLALMRVYKAIKHTSQMYLRISNSGTIKRSTANHQSLQLAAGQVEQGKREQDDLWGLQDDTLVSILFSTHRLF